MTSVDPMDKATVLTNKEKINYVLALSMLSATFVVFCLSRQTVWTQYVGPYLDANSLIPPGSIHEFFLNS